MPPKSTSRALKIILKDGTEKVMELSSTEARNAWIEAIETAADSKEPVQQSSMYIEFGKKEVSFFDAEDDEVALMKFSNKDIKSVKAKSSKVCNQSNLKG